MDCSGQMHMLQSSPFGITFAIKSLGAFVDHMWTKLRVSCVPALQLRGALLLSARRAPFPPKIPHNVDPIIIFKNLCRSSFVRHQGQAALSHMSLLLLSSPQTEQNMCRSASTANALARAQCQTASLQGNTSLAVCSTISWGQALGTPKKPARQSPTSKKWRSATILPGLSM
jgi:hypothetical protein